MTLYQINSNEDNYAASDDSITVAQAGLTNIVHFYYYNIMTTSRVLLVRYNMNTTTYLSNLSFETTLKPMNVVVKDDEKTLLLVSSQTDTYLISVSLFKNDSKILCLVLCRKCNSKLCASFPTYNFSNKHIKLNKCKYRYIDNCEAYT